jgi:hypothetical protein
MLNETQAIGELRALRTRLRQLEEIASAPRHKAETGTRIRLLEGRARRAERIALAEATDPTWLPRLEAAKLAEAEALRAFQTLEYATIVRERKAMQAEVDGPETSSFPLLPMAGTALVDRRKTTELNLLEDRWRGAKARLLRLRAWPDALAAEQERQRNPRYRASEPEARFRTLVARVSRDGRVER